jgi:cyclohexa-1,5-dienecarbonyl-CoA hydratase
MEPRFIKVDQADGIARITLARPKHNVMNIPMMNEINACLESLIGDNELKCVVFQGEGKSWCAGVEVADHKPENVDDMVRIFGRIFELMAKLEVPTLAAVHGACLGGGMELAIGCDIVMAASGAKFGQPEIKLGFFPPYAVVRLPELVGVAKTIEICTTGRIYSAREAQAMGFVAHVAEQDDFQGAVDKMVEEIRYCSPLILRMNKRIVTMTRGMTPENALAKSNAYFLETLMKTGDTLEGIASFEEKRSPVWQNR